ncbi:iron-siderophore ABC transporter substrate-binding protein [Arthrobacter castelli]|uniref:iron-siderophore ABC transporter substrate-binding protein n=1 Tax=Arthrobacter castelli TaxID=271431 RepID=UPI00042A181F|nr:iron-siderophore ABC transporter substrate-binding protein [Arthrobacter castelli]
MPRFRLQGVVATAAVALLSLSACSTGPAGGTTEGGAEDTQSTSANPDAFPVTIEHKFGKTTIKEQPERVATVSWVNADVSLALGVVPVGMPLQEWGGNENKSTPWFDARLAEMGVTETAQGEGSGPKAAGIAMYSEADGINFEGVAKTTPDVILAAYSGLTKEDYEKLSKIAPVVAYPKVAFGTPWQKTTTMIGKALGKPEQAEQLVEDTEKLVQTEAAKYPAIEGKTFIYGNLEPNSGTGMNIYTSKDNRSRFLTSLGMEMAPVVRKAEEKSGFYLQWSAERADELKSDIFVTWVPGEKTKQAIKADPLLGQIPAIKNDALVADSDNTLTLAISAASPLSLPWALDEFLPQLGEAAKAAEKAK